MTTDTLVDTGNDASRDCPRTKDVLLTGRLQGQSEVAQLWRVTDLAYLLERENARLREALENLLRPLENGWKVSDMNDRILAARAALVTP